MTIQRLALRLLALLGALALAGCLGDPDEPWIPEGWEPQADPQSMRETPQGKVVGYSHPRNAAHVYRGIPYAVPPLGARRWRGALLMQSLDAADAPGATHEFLQPAEPCTQWGNEFGSAPEEVHGKIWGSEDCLYLDVYAPRMAPGEVPGAGELLPVMVWIHGGGNTLGSTRPYDFSLLAEEQKVIVVAMQYRLGPFGFFSHPALRATAQQAVDTTPNQGILDQVIALVWVRTNIEAFGGDSNRVTIFGESAGGTNVMALMASEATRGLFHRAVAMSGSDRSLPVAEAENFSDDPDQPGHPRSGREQVVSWLLEEGQALDRESAKSLQDSMDPAQLALIMQEIDAEKIMQYYSSADQREVPPPPRVVDDTRLFLRDGTLQAGLRGVPGNPRRPANDVPAILGATRDEAKLFMAFDDRFTEEKLFGLRRTIKNWRAYQRYALHSSRLWKFRASDRTARYWRDAGKNDAWVYRFDWDDQPSLFGTNYGLLLGAAHALDIPFLTGDFNFSPRLAPLFDEYNKEGRDWLGKGMRGYWANFAATGTPGKGSDGTQYEWPNYGPDEYFLILDAPPTEFLLFRYGETLDYALGEMAKDEHISNEDRCELVEPLFRYEEEMTDELRGLFSYCEFASQPGTAAN